MAHRLCPLPPTCPVKFFEEDERSEFNLGPLALDPWPLLSLPAL
jgi:hypothetical protein